MEFQAALKGQKIKIPRVGIIDDTPKKSAISPEQEQLMDQKMKEALERKRLEKVKA